MPKFRDNHRVQVRKKQSNDNLHCEKDKVTEYDGAKRAVKVVEIKPTHIETSKNQQRVCGQDKKMHQYRVQHTGGHPAIKTILDSFKPRIANSYNER